RAPRRAVGINAKSSATHATTIGGCETSVARRVRSSRIEGSKKLLGSGSAFNATPGRAGLPAEFKHINKRRKRNLQGFPYRQNGSVTSGKGLAARAGHGGPGPEPVGCRWICSSCSRGESGSPLARSYRAPDYDRTPLSRIRARSDACARRPFADPRRGPRPPKARVVGEALAADELRGPP
ncbi:unnamed protein product, partial [Prunus brigantina]